MKVELRHQSFGTSIKVVSAMDYFAIANNQLLECPSSNPC